MFLEKSKSLVIAVFCAVFLYGCGPGEDVAITFSEEDAAMPGVPSGPACTDDRAAAPDVQEEPQMVYVYLCGAVAEPGVYQLAAGSRLYEAVEMAGGLTEDADAACFNLARQLSDGEQILVLTCEETARLEQEGRYIPGQPLDAAGSEPSGSSGLVNINTASLSELMDVPGIGEGKAQAIIAYREQNGGFRCIEDIKKVDGIKDGLFSKIRDRITV